MKKRHSLIRSGLATAAVIGMAMASPPLRAAEHVTLRNGFEFDCVRREATGDRVRLYLLPSGRAGAAGQNVAGQIAAEDANYIEVAASAVVRVESIPDPPPPAAVAAPVVVRQVSAAVRENLTQVEMREMLARAGALHNIDVDLLASVVEAESGGHVLAVSRAGAQGLMQLMPATAIELNVHNSFEPEENIGGGAAYLDAMLTRYGDNIALALAAYNAGPEAVDRYHGIPPYAETRVYVARVIREFNQRKQSVGVGMTASAK